MRTHRAPAFEMLERRARAHCAPAPDALSFLYDINHAQRRLSRGERLQTEGEAETRVYLVQSGWLVGVHETDAEQRSIPQIFLPGDLIGWNDVNWSFAARTVDTVTDAQLVAFSKQEAERIFREGGEAGWIMHCLNAIDFTWALDLNRVLSRSSALSRVAYLLLALKARMRFMTEGEPDTLVCPLKQNDIGDAIGLTNISVSRSLKDLSDSGLVSRTSRTYTFHDREALVEMTGFVDRIYKAQSELA